MAVEPFEYWGRRFVAFILAVWAASVMFGFMWALMVLIFAALAACVIGIGRPTIGMLGIGALCTLSPVATPLLFTGGLWRWNTVSYCLLLVQIVFVRFLLGLSDPHTRLLKAFAAFLAIQLLVTPDLEQGMQQVLVMLSPFAYLIYFGRTAKDDVAWYWLAVVAGTLAAAGGLIYFIQRDLVPPLNENVSAHFPLTALFAICLGIRFARDVSKQRVLMGLAVANLGWIIFSGSRGALTIAACCLVYFVTQLPTVKTGLLFTVSLVVVAFSIATAFPGRRDHALSKLQRMVDSNLPADQRTNGRSDLLAGGLRIFRENPFGVGTGGFPEHWSRLNSVEGQKYFHHVGIKTPAHAGWITVLAENGVVGVALLASFILSFAIVPLVRRRKEMVLLGVFASVTLAVAFTSSELSQTGLWFLAAGVITVYRQAEPSHRRRAIVRPWRHAIIPVTDVRPRATRSVRAAGRL